METRAVAFGPRSPSGPRRWTAHDAAVTATLAGLAIAAPVPLAAQVNDSLAGLYFEEAAELCEAEGGRLWGVSLCGPMVFADAATGTLATNRPLPDAKRPPLLGYANAAIEWGGVRWAIYVWPLPAEDARLRGEIMLHELFHRIQPDLGLALPEPKNDHLETTEGRYWLQLEWRALAAALAASGAEREAAIRDALAFRRARRDRFAEAAENERVLELQEGLAQYTGVVASTASPEEAAGVAIRELSTQEWLSSLVRTFGYGSGAAYGVLLDEYSPGWTPRLAPTDDLGRLLMAASGLRPAEDPGGAAARYGGPALRAAEEAREAENEARIADLRRRFVEGPVLALPDAGHYSFVSQGITPLGDHGSVYPTVRSSAKWGSVEAVAALIAPDGSRMTLPAPGEVRGDTLRGDGYTLTLNPGWVVRPGPRPGDLVAVPNSAPVGPAAR